MPKRVLFCPYGIRNKENYLLYSSGAIVALLFLLEVLGYAVSTQLKFWLVLVVLLPIFTTWWVLTHTTEYFNTSHTKCLCTLCLKHIFIKLIVSGESSCKFSTVPEVKSICDTLIKKVNLVDYAGQEEHNCYIIKLGGYINSRTQCELETLLRFSNYPFRLGSLNKKDFDSIIDNILCKGCYSCLRSLEYIEIGKYKMTYEYAELFIKTIASYAKSENLCLTGLAPELLERILEQLSKINTSKKLDKLLPSFEWVGPVNSLEKSIMQGLPNTINLADALIITKATLQK